ncbi:MAG: hypothetical protein H2069_04805 [Legionella sp.]|nr:hypothetical protein [Legionella sp.]
MKNIQAIGIPFYALIDPFVGLQTKMIYLLSLVSFLIAMTKAQHSFIKGGTFNEYLCTLDIPINVHKIIDFILLLFSLNLIWLAIIFGGMRIMRNTEGILFCLSQYCLYVSTIFLLCTLLFCLLYKKITSGLLMLAACFFVIFVSKEVNWLLNNIVGMSAFLLCCYINCTIALDQTKPTPYFRPWKGYWLPQLVRFRSTKNNFIIQLAVLRKNKVSFLIKLVICIALSTLISNVLTSDEAIDNQWRIMLVLMNLQGYFLSTLFSFFEQEKRSHNLFHSIFPYQKYLQPLNEVMIVWALLMLAITPIVFLYIFMLESSVAKLLIVCSLSGLTLAINRMLYKQSLRFCLFTSLLNTVIGGLVQYGLLEA